MQNLKPCPFCGGTDSVDNAVQEAKVVNRQVPTPLRKRGWEVQCECGAKGPRSLDYHESAALWNNRKG